LTADETGAFNAHFTIPKSVPAGEHTIKIDGISKSGKLTTVSVGVLVIEPEVASNGVDTGQPVDGDSTGISAQAVAVLGGIVVMLLLVGAGLLVSARRRRRSE
jgi:LPXTG-motif cell wall-anchored protein